MESAQGAWWGTALLIAATLAAGTAQGNAGVYARTPSFFAGAPVLAPTSLVVEEEQLGFDCRSRGAGAVCEFEAVYFVRNPTDAAEQVAGAFYGLRATDVTVTVDGRDIGTDLAPQWLEELDRASGIIEDHIPEPSKRKWKPLVSEADLPNLSRTGFMLKVEAGQRVELVARGTIRLDRTDFEAVFLPAPAVRGRHFFMSTASWAPVEILDLDYLVSPIRTWADVGPIHITIRFPASWKLEGGFVDSRSREDLYDPPDTSNEQWTLRREGGTKVASLSTGAHAGRRLAVSFRRPPDRFYNGGVQIGGGYVVEKGTVCPWDQTGRCRELFRFRVGYEVAAPSWVLYSMSIETDFTNRFLLSPLVTASPPHLLGLFGIAGSAGPIIDLVGEVEVGLRWQLELHFVISAFILAWELYPTRPLGDPEQLHLVLMWRTSL